MTRTTHARRHRLARSPWVVVLSLGTMLFGASIAAALPPSVLLFSPTSGPVGTDVTITGSGFDDVSPVTGVTFDGTAAAFTVDSAVQMTATVPAGATTGPIAVTDAEGTSTTVVSFTVTTPPAPTVLSFVPVTGPVGTDVTIAGTDFTDAISVAFNGTDATFTVDSDTSITATVPADATTGPIAVTTPSGTGTSAIDFTVTASGSPTVIGFVPTSGPVGTDVTIAGTDFTDATSVTFNGTTASFTVDSDESIRASVPAAATTGVIAVTTPSGTGTSAIDFVVTQREYHERSITLRLRRSLVAAGRVQAVDDFGLCESDATVLIRRRSETRWRTVAITTTDADGAFRVRIRPLAGRYAAIAPRVDGDDDVCLRSSSLLRRFG